MNALSAADSSAALANPEATAGLVESLRASAPYVHAHRGRTFVIHLPGEAAAAPAFAELVYDIALLASLGVRVVIAFGARPQIDATLVTAGVKTRFAAGLRVTDTPALACVKQAVGGLQMDIEALLSTSLASTAMAGARIATASGNLVTARPVGVVHGVDHGHTGEVRRVAGENLKAALARSQIVLLPPIGYSPSGETFNLLAEEIATATATALAADKLVLLHPGAALHERLAAPAQLGVEAAEKLLADGDTALADTDRTRLRAALTACNRGVTRAHLVSFAADGALLRELYSRDGAGTMIGADHYDAIRTATPEDLAGVLVLIEPLVEAGILVARSREAIELDIEHYLVLERDGLITACCALMPYPEADAGELACVAVHPAYRNENRAVLLLAEAERRARRAGLTQLFVLTTKAPHWFVEHGFKAADITALPTGRRAHYNAQRNSAVFVKKL